MTNHPPKVSEWVKNLWESVTGVKNMNPFNKHEISNALNGINMKYYLNKVKIQKIPVVMSAIILMQILGDSMARRYYILHCHFVQRLWMLAPNVNKIFSPESAY